MKKINVAIIGNPNTGKTSIFNALTGAKQTVGNWPGVTVEKKEGKIIYKDYEINIIDLPGIYGLTASSEDEKIVQQFLLKGEYDLLINVMDSTNLERNLYLTMELREMNIPIIITLNMIDIVKKHGVYVDKNLLSKIFNSYVVETVGREEKGIDELKNAIINGYENVDKLKKPFKCPCPEELEIAINNLSRFLEKQLKEKNYPIKWITTKFLEGSIDVIKILNLYEIYLNVKNYIDRSNEKIKNLKGLSIDEYIIESKYSFLKGLTKELVKKIKDEHDIKQRMDLSEKIDKIVLNKIFGIPIFLFVMWATFYLTFKVGNPVADILDSLFIKFGNIISFLLTQIHTPEIFISLVRDGIISGVGSVIVFLPNILILFFIIAILEDSGYMARAAFTMDNFMHFIGLHGKSFIPMIIGFGCNVPAIMATRTLESKKDKFLTILAIPFMSCSARLPIYILFTSAFFKNNQSLIVWSLYVSGIIIGILTVKIFKNLLFKKETIPLIMELPPYRMPHLKTLLLHMWFRAKMFLKKAGTVILVGVIIIWILSSFPYGVEYASDKSLLGILGKVIAPVFYPAGFGFWQAGVALISGIMAKEIVVGTLGALLAKGTDLTTALQTVFTPLSAISFMIMSLLYIPCLPTIAVIKSETTRNWAVLVVSYTLFIGWILAVIVYQIGRILGYG